MDILMDLLWDDSASVVISHVLERESSDSSYILVVASHGGMFVCNLCLVCQPSALHNSSLLIFSQLTAQ